jgi:hypothetical protein
MLRKIFLIVVVIVGLLVLDLYTFEFILQDPGYYVVARRSDNPRQVLNALGRIDRSEVDPSEWELLLDRYRRKARSDQLSRQQRQRWKNVLRRLESLLAEKEK